MTNRFSTLTVISAALLWCILLPSTAMAGSWSHVEESDGVDVYERNARYLGDQVLRGVIEVDLPIGLVLAVFLDPEERPNWVYRVAEDESLEIDEDSDLAWSETYWTRIDMPFPVSDRDYVMRADYEFHPEDRKVTALMQSTSDPRKPEPGCCVRARSLTNYTIEAIPGEKERTRISVMVETDLGGSVPSGLVRRAGPDWPSGTLSALVELAKSPGVVMDERVRDWHD